jgi:hypothetical protein
MKQKEAKGLIILEWDRWVQTRSIDSVGQLAEIRLGSL